MTHLATQPSAPTQPGAAGWTLRALCALAALVACAPATASLPALWTDARFMGHGYLIPLVSAFLLFNERERIREALLRAQPPAHGALVALASSSLMALAVLGSSGFTTGMMIPAVLLALIPFKNMELSWIKVIHHH